MCIYFRSEQSCQVSPEPIWFWNDEALGALLNEYTSPKQQEAREQEQDD